MGILIDRYTVKAAGNTVIIRAVHIECMSSGIVMRFILSSCRFVDIIFGIIIIEHTLE